MKNLLESILNKGALKKNIEGIALIKAITNALIADRMLEPKDVKYSINGNTIYITMGDTPYNVLNKKALDLLKQNNIKNIIIGGNSLGRIELSTSGYDFKGFTFKSEGKYKIFIRTKKAIKNLQADYDDVRIMYNVGIKNIYTQNMKFVNCILPDLRDLTVAEYTNCTLPTGNGCPKYPISSDTIDNIDSLIPFFKVNRGDWDGTVQIIIPKLRQYIDKQLDFNIIDLFGQGNKITADTFMVPLFNYSNRGSITDIIFSKQDKDKLFKPHNAASYMRVGLTKDNWNIYIHLNNILNTRLTKANLI